MHASKIAATDNSMRPDSQSAGNMQHITSANCLSKGTDCGQRSRATLVSNDRGQRRAINKRTVKVHKELSLENDAAALSALSASPLRPVTLNDATTGTFIFPLAAAFEYLPVKRAAGRLRRERVSNSKKRDNMRVHLSLGCIVVGSACLSLIDTTRKKEEVITFTYRLKVRSCKAHNLEPISRVRVYGYVRVKLCNKVPVL